MIEFELQDFCINAGIVGLYEILIFADSKEQHYKKDNYKLYVEKDWLISLDLSDLYFKSLIKKYQKICPLTRIIKNLEIFKNTEQDIKSIKAATKKIEESLASNRYKSGYELIKNELEFNLYDDLKKLKASTMENYEKNAKIVLKDLENEKLKNMFLIKDIIYFVIKYFWNDVSFLNRQNSGNDPKEEFYKTFEKPFKDYVKEEPKGKEYCIECGMPIKGNFKMKTSYINSLSEDFARKNSNYWNFKPNCYVCPKCNFLFGIMPLGFLPYGKNYVFVNNNISLDTLIKSNKESLLEDNSLSYYEQYNNVLQNLSKTNLYKLDNLEIITNLIDLERYKFDIISKTILLKIKDNEKDLKIISKLGVLRIDNEIINVYDEVMSRIFDNQSLYPLLHNLLLISINKDYAKVFCNYVYKIENGGKEMKDYWKVRVAGEKMRLAMERQESGRIDSLCYDIANMISNNKNNELYDLVFNLSVKTKVAFPIEMYEIIEDKNKIKLVGYAFATGFITGKESEKDE